MPFVKSGQSLPTNILPSMEENTQEEKVTLIYPVVQSSDLQPDSIFLNSTGESIESVQTAKETKLGYVFRGNQTVGLLELCIPTWCISY